MISAPAPPVDTPPAATASMASTAVPSGFDSIMMLQGLATRSLLDAATFEPADTNEALAGDDAADDDTDDDIEASLAFLANLIAATSSPGSSPEFEGGAGGSRGGDANSASPRPLDADGVFALVALATEGGEGKVDALPGMTAVDPELLDLRQASGDASQNLARAAELLAQAPRPAAETARLVATHVREPRWADDFGARISLMVRGGESTASLQLTPVDLGPVEVSVTVKDSQASIHFGASQAETRALLESSLPKLRELLASQGFNLLDASVSSGFSRSKHPEFRSAGNEVSEIVDAPSEAQPMRNLALLDLYV